MSPDRGLLIVNADDWGYDEPTTRAIADCHRAGGLTSTTAMVFMEGSRAAAERARDLPQLGIGLHLNLIEEYSDSATPAPVRERQRRLIEYFRRRRLRRWLYDPWVRREVDRIVADQFEGFVELYGRAPTHLDGHHHCHLAANVLLSPSVPRGTKIRNALSDGRSGALVDGLRQVRERALYRRFRSTNYFFSVVTAWPGLRGQPPDDQLGLSRRASVEIMVHPAFPEEYDPLRSPEWTTALRALPTGTFEDL
jgi:chitin disaccharide deacetylase